MVRFGSTQGAMACYDRPEIFSLPQADPQYQGIWFVSDKNYEKNQIIIVKGHDNPKLFKQTVELTQLEWLHQGKGVLSPIIAISVSFIAEVNPCYKNY